MTKHKALHTRDYVDKKEGREPTSIEGSVDATIRLEDYIKKLGERLITATRNYTDNMRINVKIIR